MKGLNLKSFKKVSGDDDHSVMQHSDGHQIKILHKPLSPKMKKDLIALPLAEGGKVPDSKPSNIPGGSGSPALDEEKTKQFSKGASESGVPSASDAWKNIKEGLGFAKGGPVQRYADGGVSEMPSEVDQIVQDAQSAPVRPEYEQALAQEQANSSPQMNAVYGTPEQRALQDLKKTDVESGAAAQYAAQQGRIQGMVDANKGAPATPPQNTPAIAPGSPPSPSEAPGSPNPQGAIPASPDDVYYKSLQSGIGQQIQGAQMGAKAAEAQGAAEVAAHKTEIDNLQRAQDMFGERLKHNLDQNDAFIKDVQNSHIDPNHYYGSLDTGKKISTVIGLVLGGLGSGIGGGENMAMKILQSRIDRDIDAQKANLGFKKSLLEANMQQTKNIGEAMSITRAQMTALADAQVQQAASQAKGPMAKAAAMQLSGQLKAQYGGQLASVAASQALAKANSNNDPGALGAMIQQVKRYNPEYGKSLEERFVPGVGLAQVPVPQAVRDTITAKQTLGKMAQDFYNWSAQHSGSLDPKTVAVGHTKAAELQSMYRNAINGGVFKKGEQEFIDNIVDSDPTKFFNKIRVLPKLQEVIRSNNAQQQILHKSVGLPMPQAPQATPEMRTMNGVQYQKVQGGWQRVK